MIELFRKPLCLLCHGAFAASYSWASLSPARKKPLLCPECREKLEPLTGVRCRICSRMMGELKDIHIHDEAYCSDCFRWERHERWQGVLAENISFYKYNTYAKEIMAKFKYRGDYAISELFASHIKETVENRKPDYLVPIPLSAERLYERGFNQSEALIVKAGLAPAQLLMRTHSEKQAKKTRKQRMDLENIFLFHEEADVKDKNIILVDDIYTTGSTLRYAAEQLRLAGAESVSSITAAR